MKKFFEFAVAATIVALCSVMFWNCSGSEIYGDEPNIKPTDPTVESVERNNCTENVVNSYTADNAEIKTRAITVPQGNYEALISAQSVHQLIADVFYTDGSVKKDEVIMLNITGGGESLTKEHHDVVYAKPDLIIDTYLPAEEVIEKVERLFGI